MGHITIMKIKVKYFCQFFFAMKNIIIATKANTADIISAALLGTPNSFESE